MHGSHEAAEAQDDSCLQPKMHSQYSELQRSLLVQVMTWWIGAAVTDACGCVSQGSHADGASSQPLYRAQECQGRGSIKAAAGPRCPAERCYLLVHVPLARSANLAVAKRVRCEYHYQARGFPPHDAEMHCQLKCIPEPLHESKLLFVCQ